MRSKNLWSAAFLIGIAAGIVITVVMTVLDWQFNPGGLFHDGKSTNWPVVAETAFSWFAPVSAIAIVVAVCTLYLVRRRR